MATNEDNITESFGIVMRLIANLSARVETCKTFLHSTAGVTPEDFESAVLETKRVWDQQSSPILEAIADRRSVERLKSLLQTLAATKP